jgi:hypothetical protein
MPNKASVSAHPEREAVEGFNAKPLRQVEGERYLTIRFLALIIFWVQRSYK